MGKHFADRDRCHALDAVSIASASPDEKGGIQMSAGLALCIAALTIGSCLACYYLGRESMHSDIRDNQEKRRRWQEWEDEEK
jgi:hypothetical protein